MKPVSAPREYASAAGLMYCFLSIAISMLISSKNISSAAIYKLFLNQRIFARKHSMVFSIRQHMVIGPTPPGTGVMTEALGATAS